MDEPARGSAPDAKPTPRCPPGGRVHVSFTGRCERRALDTRRLELYFRLNHFVLVDRPEDADAIVLMTCAVTASYEAGSLAAVERMAGLRGELMVVGCLPAMAAHKLKERFAGKALAIFELSRIDSFFPGIVTPFEDVPELFVLPAEPVSLRVKIRDHLPALRAPRLMWAHGRQALRDTLARAAAPAGRRERPLLRIAQRSKPAQKCVAQYRQLLADGYRQFVLDGDDVGAWGVDLGASLPALLREMARATDGARVGWYLNHLNPQWVVKHQADLAAHAAAGRLDGVNCPVQSGSPRILRLMNRYPDAELGQTVDLLARMEPQGVLVSAFNPVDDTPAALIEPRVAPDVVAARVARVASELRRAGVFVKVNQK